MLRPADRGGFSCVKDLDNMELMSAGRGSRHFAPADRQEGRHGTARARPRQSGDAGGLGHLAPSLEGAGRDPVRLAPPGFGAAVPPDFQVTPAGYRDWLIGELERFGELADVLGHDWGGPMMYRKSGLR